MSILQRLFKVGEAKANQIVDGLEKPELMLEQAIRDQDKHLREAKAKVAQVIATERKTKRTLDKEKEENQVWIQRAEKALAAGNEELATKALTRAEEHEQNAATIQAQWESQQKDVEGLKQQIRKLETELAELKRNKDIIIAQSKSAEVKKSIYEAKASIGSKNSTSDLIARMKAKAERTSDEAAAAQDMAEEFDGKDELEKEFESLGSATASVSVQEKLAAMKSKMGAVPAG
jgi:phage shock protein A